MESTSGNGPVETVGLESVVVRAEQISPTSIRSFLQLVDPPQYVWATEEQTIACGGATVTLTASGPDRFTDIQRAGSNLFDTLEVAGEYDGSIPDHSLVRLFGGFSFTHSTDAMESTTWDGFPDGWFILPTVQLRKTSQGTTLIVTASGPDADEQAVSTLDSWRTRLETLPTLTPRRQPAITNRTFTPSRETWQGQVDDTIAAIRQGRLQKVVLAQSQGVELAQLARPVDVLTSMADTHPGCDRFLIRPTTGRTFFGATPERLVSVRANKIHTEAVAGSIERGPTEDVSERLATILEESEKNTHEHALVVDAIVDQLSTVATDVRAGERTVRRLATVQHLASPIHGSLPPDGHILDVVDALHPTPAVGGLPPDDALETIRDTESFDRGWYAAPVGWFDAEGDGTFSVAIRSAVARDHLVQMFAGAGIVADSDPEDEWAELQLKYQPVLDEFT